MLEGARAAMMTDNCTMKDLLSSNLRCVCERSCVSSAYFKGLPAECVGEIKRIAEMTDISHTWMRQKHEQNVLNVAFTAEIN